MTCPYDMPEIKDCLNCPLPDCVRSLTADHAAYVRAWRKRNPEKAKEIDKRKRAKKSEEQKKRDLERLEKWKKENPDKVRQSTLRNNRKWRERNREKERERNRMNYLKRKGKLVG